MANEPRGALLHSPAAVTWSIKRGRELAVDELFDEVPPAPAAQIRSDQTNCRKALLRPNRPPSLWYRLSWRGLQSGALTPEIEVDHPGDYATLNSYHSRDGTFDPSPDFS